MLYEIETNDDGLIVTKRFLEKSASELGIREKTIENWIAGRPDLLFPNEQILIIGQSISGKGMADVLALDSLGNLILVEIKRDWSDPATVGQLLSYVAEFQGVTYERLNAEAQRYAKWKGGDLLSSFREFIDNENFPKEDLSKRQRVFIVAPDSDDNLKKIVAWLKSYGVPIQFIPFKLLSDAEGELRFIGIEGVESEIELPPTDDSWDKHWIFNTNESFGPGAYKRMFEQGIIAIYGYDNGPRNLRKGASKGDKVLAYVNGQGIRALGTIVDANVQEGQGIFLDENGNQQPDEYHLKVKWDCVLPEDKALSNREASSIGYNLPVRIVFGRLHRGELAEKLVKAILSRTQCLPLPRAQTK